MPVVYRTSLKTTRMQAVVTDIGSGGKIKLYTAGKAVLLAVLALDAVAGTVAGPTLTLSGMPKTTTGVGAGNAAVAEVTTSADAVVIDGLTVGTSGADILVDNVNVAVGQQVRVNSGTITHG